MTQNHTAPSCPAFWCQGTPHAFSPRADDRSLALFFLFHRR